MSSGAQDAILNFPSGIDIFSIKYDKGIVFSGESHIIPSGSPYELYSNYVPLYGSTINIPGFSQIFSGTVSINQYYVTYSGINAGLFQFASGNSGQNIAITYTTRGDILRSEYINSLQTSVVNVENYVLANIASGNYVHISGDIITGNIVMDSSNIVLKNAAILSQPSSTSTIGNNSLPIDSVYSQNAYFNSLSILSSPYISIFSSLVSFSGNDLGTLANPWENIYINKISKNITLSSGASILVTSGNSIGDNSNRLENLFVQNIDFNSISGNFANAFVNKSGDTVNGNLTINSPYSLIVNNISGNTNINVSSDIIPDSTIPLNLGSPSKPFGKIYVETIDATTLSGTFVNKYGDDMFGDLNIQNATLRTDYITHSSVTPSGNISINTNELNVDVSNNIRMSVDGVQRLEVGLNAIYTDSDIIPIQSGLNSIGIQEKTFGDLWVERIHTNLPSQYILSSGSTSSGLELLSGSSIIGNSGTSIGTITNPIDTIYANNIISTQTSGNYVSKFGDTIYGTLTLGSGVSIISSTSGMSNLGTITNPFGTIYADNFIGTSGGTYVRNAGDTMTGGLIINSPSGLKTAYIYGNETLNISGTFIDILSQQTNISSYNGPIILDGQTEVQLLYNSNPKLSVSYSGTILHDNMLPETSGTLNIGSPDYRFKAIYVDNIYTVGASGSSGLYVLKTGDGMSGNLTMTNSNILTSTSGVNTIGTLSTPWSGVFADNIFVKGISIQSLINGSYLPTSGGSMYGNILMLSGTKIGFGNTNPQALIHIGSGVVGTVGSNALIFGSPLSGANIGNYSTLFGLENSVVGNYSVSFGEVNKLMGNSSISFGASNIASGNGLLIGGYNNISNGSSNNLLLVGASNIISLSSYSIVGGVSNKLRGLESLVIGANNEVYGDNCVAGGATNYVSGIANTVFGSQNQLIGMESLICGTVNSGSSSWALTFGAANINNGNFSIVGGAGNTNTSTGNWSANFGAGNICAGTKSIVVGGGNNVEAGEALIALGKYNYITGYASTVIGENCILNGSNNIFIGKNISGTTVGSISIGNNIIASGSYNVIIANSVNTVSSNSTYSMTLGFDNGIALASGTNIFPQISGQNTIGTAAKPFNRIYANGIYDNLKTISGTYALATNDSVILCDTSLNSVTVQCISIDSGKSFTIKDKSGNASINKIIVSGVGCSIDGNNISKIDANYGTIKIISDGSNYFII